MTKLIFILALIIAMPTLASELSRTKIVNGEPVTMGDEEYSARKAESDAQEISGVRARLFGQFQREALRRIEELLPKMADMSRLEALDGMWPALSGTAPSALIRTHNIYLYSQTTVKTKLSGLSLVQMAAITVDADDPFDDGTPWP
jgi:hypothetical protein